MALTKVNNGVLDLSGSTDALALPKGTTAQRPTSPIQCTIRHNTEIDETKLETFDGTDWRILSKVVTAYLVDYLVVAGGGGGGGAKGGNATVYSSGGGAGGYKNDSILFNKNNTYNVSIGSGGVGGFGQGTTFATQGVNSFLSGPDITTVTSTNGFPGGLSDTSPGGNSGYLPSNTGGISSSSYLWSQGGGAGIGANGGNAISGSTPGNGGAGLSFNISGNSVFYAGGGGGGMYQGNNSLGGSGGGGNGYGTNSNGNSGSANTGGGGGAAGAIGGSGSSDYTGGSGGSGIVILRMPTANYSNITTGSPTVTTDGTDTILTYNSSGTYTA